jgi:hypothetical protein
VASPHFRTDARSRYLKHLPGQMGAAFRAALADPELLSLREEAALLTTRITQLLDRLKDTPPGPDYDAVWTDLRDVILDRARVTAAEVRRLVTLQGVVTVEDALLWARALLSAARKVVTDRDQLRRLQERALALLPPADDYGPARRPVVLDNGHAGTPPAAPPSCSSPGGGGESGPTPAGPPPAPAPPAPGPPGGLEELPPGADPDDYEWVDDGEVPP